MTKTKRFISLVAVLIMLISMFSVYSISASAVSTYDCSKTRTITVTTQSGGISKPSITFKCKSAKECGSHGISNYAPKMSLKIYDHKTGTTTYKRITGSGSNISSTLKLEKGRSYTITVSYIYNKSINYNAFCVGGGSTWAEGTWWISSTNRISTYKVK